MDSADNCLDLILFRSFYSLKSIKIQPWTSFSQTSLVTVVSSSLLLHIHNYSGNSILLLIEGGEVSVMMHGLIQFFLYESLT